MSATKSVQVFSHLATIQSLFLYVRLDGEISSQLTNHSKILRSLTLIKSRLQFFIYLRVDLIVKGKLMFFWPCIINRLYINYQLDAL